MNQDCKWINIFRSANQLEETTQGWGDPSLRKELLTKQWTDLQTGLIKHKKKFSNYKEMRHAWTGKLSLIQEEEEEEENQTWWEYYGVYIT